MQQWADDYPYLHYCETHDCDALESPPSGLNDRERSLWDEINVQQFVAGTIFSQVKIAMCLSTTKGCVGRIFRFLNLAHWASQMDVSSKTGSLPEGTIPGTRLRVDVYKPGFTSIAEIKPNNPFSLAAGAKQIVVYSGALRTQLGVPPTLGLGVTGSWVSYFPMFLVTTVKTTYVGTGLFGYECSGIPSNAILETAMQGQTFRQFVNQWVAAANIDPALAAGTSTPKAFAKALLRGGYSTWTAAAAVFARFGTSFAEGLSTVANSITSPISAFTILVGIVTLIAVGTLD